ncbi:TPA: hypothetical protein ACP337_006010, partial [Pseudomonas aeruginosa]
GQLETAWLPRAPNWHVFAWTHLCLLGVWDTMNRTFFGPSVNHASRGRTTSAALKIKLPTVWRAH